jgi:hypothetical protein
MLLINKLIFGLFYCILTLWFANKIYNSNYVLFTLVCIFAWLFLCVASYIIYSVVAQGIKISKIKPRKF